MNAWQFAKLSYLSLLQSIWPVRQQRVCEPHELMEDDEQVIGFDHAGETTLDLIYCLAIELIYKWHIQTPIGRAIDLGCGTCNFAVRLNKSLDCIHTLGIDGSNRMLDFARRKISNCHLEARIEVDRQDITQLINVQAGMYDLATCILTAHHLDDTTVVRRLLERMSQIVRDDGTVLLLDLGRLNSEYLIGSYVRIFSKGQTECHNMDFYNSMRAAFRPDELRGIVPKNNEKHIWFHFTSPGLPTLQAIMRVPRDSAPRLHALWDKSPDRATGNLSWRFLRSGLMNCSSTAAKHSRCQGVV